MTTPNTGMPIKRKTLEKIIELKNLSKIFGKTTVVDDISLNIVRGEFVTLLGPSGCGKTTLLRMIAGFETPTSGGIYLEGKDVTKIPPYNRNVNTVFQKYALFPHLDVHGNIAYGLKLRKILLPEQEINEKLEKLRQKKSEEVVAKTEERLRTRTRLYTKKEIKAKVNDALKLVGLEDYGHRDVDSLSGGQQQRVAIARALVNEPRVLLLDEPLGALDLKMRKEMQAELRRMHKELGITFIYVTHDQEEALTMSDTIVVINDGEIQQVGSPQAIYDKPANAFVADFIGESNILSGIMLGDNLVKFLGKSFNCVSKGFAKNQPVDIVIRPEDITVHVKKSTKTQLNGKVISNTFLGTFFEVEIEVNDGEYQFTVQTNQNIALDAIVGLEIKPENIHIMAMEATINEIEAEMTAGDWVKIAGKEFEVTPQNDANGEEFGKGDRVTAFIPFDKIELTDDENDGTVGGWVTHTLYKGSYYQVKVWTDNDTLFIINTQYEWDINDRVGIKILPTDIRIQAREDLDVG